MDNYQYLDNQFTNSFEGSIDILNNEFEELVVNFKSGTLDIENGESQKVSWKCQMDSPPKAEYVNKSSAIIELDFEKLDGIACTLRVAPELKVTIDGHDGRLQIKEPLFDIYAEIKFGQIIFTPNPEIDYQYLVEVGQGQKSEFISSNKDGAVEINLNVGSGQVMRTDL